MSEYLTVAEVLTEQCRSAKRYLDLIGIKANINGLSDRQVICLVSDIRRVIEEAAMAETSIDKTVLD